jgi:acetyltransferase-like isoleucine patch superfamily enzyme
VEDVYIAQGVKIGSLNVFRDLRQVYFESNSSLGNLNWISASPVFGNLESSSRITLGKRAVVTNRHYLDVSGGFSMGTGSALTGVRSTVITHGVNPSSSAQEIRTVTIGRNTLIGSNAVIAPGARVGDFQVFGMGSLISGVYSSSFELHLSKKAIPTRSVLPASRFFEVTDD